MPEWSSTFARVLFIFSLRSLLIIILKTLSMLLPLLSICNPLSLLPLPLLIIFNYLSLLPLLLIIFSSLSTPLLFLELSMAWNSLTFSRRGNLTFWTGQRRQRQQLLAVTSLVACLELLVINWLSSWLGQAKWQRLIYCAYAPWSSSSTHKFRASCCCCCCYGSCCLRKSKGADCSRLFVCMCVCVCVSRCEAHHHQQQQRRRRCLPALPGRGELHFHGS